MYWRRLNFGRNLNILKKQDKKTLQTIQQAKKIDIKKLKKVLTKDK